VALHRAYSLLTVKSIDADRRRIHGIASTPTPDRQGDIVDPLGATFPADLPLLLHHRADQPVGIAHLQTTADGITFEAELPLIADPGHVKDAVDRAWTSIVHGLIRGVSIGFRALAGGLEPLKAGGLRFRKIEIVELSLVTVPANQDATMAIVRSLDASYLAAPGPHPSGVSEIRPTGSAMTIADQIIEYQNTRAARSARMTELMNTAAASHVTLDAADTEEYDHLAAEVKAVDAHLLRMRDLEKTQAAAATPIVPAAGVDPKAAAAARAGTLPIIQVKSQLPKGTGFVRFCQAVAYGRGDTMRSLEFAKQWKDSTPEVELVLKAAVAPGNTTDATWAGPLAALTPLASEFLELLRPATILGRVPGLKQVPFNVSVPSQTGGGTYQWIGQGAPKPVGKLQFGTITLTPAKAAGIIVITLELARFSSPSAESVIRADMIAGMAAFLDQEFIDPTKAAVAGVSPGSITNGVTPITTAGTSPANARTDIIALLNAITAANLPVSNAVLIMSETNALALTYALNPLGQPLFPDMGLDGGKIKGLTVVPSQAAGTTVAALVPEAILYADDGGVTIDVSTEASLQMDSAPMAVPDATVVMTSLWQNNLVGLRAERFINWKKARAGCVQYTVATYNG
jgi:HK97 family phage major capsid protein/HK97 family phage prohead protease